MPDGRAIQSKFDAMKRLFSASPLDPGITALFKEINDLCQNEASAMQRLPLTSNTTARGKNYRCSQLTQDIVQLISRHYHIYGSSILLSRRGLCV